MGAATCEMITRFMRTGHCLLVAKLVNLRALQASSSLPTTDLAIQRFQAGVCAHTNKWVGRGALSGGHYALVLPADSELDVDALKGSIGWFSFEDPWRAGHSVELFGIGCSVPLDEAAGIADVFEVVDRLLCLEEEGAAGPYGFPYANAVETWCR